MSASVKHYGECLYELAAEEALEDRILEELDAVARIFEENPNYPGLLSSLRLNLAERIALLDEAFRSCLHLYTLNVIKILCGEGLLMDFNACRKAYRARHHDEHGIIEVTVSSAVALDGDARKGLMDKLTRMTGKPIELTVKLDPSLLGGLRLDMEGVRYDGTLRRRLENLRSAIGESI